jgi:hypothetical protein
MTLAFSFFRIFRIPMDCREKPMKRRTAYILLAIVAPLVLVVIAYNILDIDAGGGDKQARRIAFAACVVSALGFLVNGGTAVSKLVWEIKQKNEEKRKKEEDSKEKVEHQLAYGKCDLGHETLKVYVGTICAFEFFIRCVEMRVIDPMRGEKPLRIRFATGKNMLVNSTVSRSKPVAFYMADGIGRQKEDLRQIINTLPTSNYWITIETLTTEIRRIEGSEIKRALELHTDFSTNGPDPDYDIPNTQPKFETSREPFVHRETR